MGYRIRAAVLVIMVSTGCWACVAAMLGSPGSNIYLGYDGKIYKNQGEADQTFQKALAEIPERGKPVADRALVVLPSATAIGLYQLKMQDQMMAKMKAMSPGFGGSEGTQAVSKAMERMREQMQQYLERYQALYVEALQKRQAFKQLVVEKSDRPGLVLRPEYDVNILLVLKDSGQQECVVKTSPLNFSMVSMPGTMTNSGVGLIQWLEALENQAAVLLKRQKRAAMAR